MFNEFQLEIIAAAVLVCIFILYFIFKRSSTSQATSMQPDQHETVEATVPEKINAVIPQIKEEVPKEQVIIADNTMGRRRSDKIFQKRAVPSHEKITKQHFSEFSGERILVAEDNPINQKVILGVMSDSGIEVIVANDGQEALDILENDSNFLMILMDAHMPRIDGFEATRIIRSNPKYDHILIVALSGDIATDDVQKMKDAGMDEQLAKPLRMEALYGVIYAYSTKETKKEVKPAIATKILDSDKGLETCGGDETFYREILSEFIDDYGNSSQTLGELLRIHNIQAADALLLDIIGVSENIGAHDLGEIASNMKLSLRDTDERNYFSFYDQYKVHFEKLVQEIRAYL